MDAEHTFHEFLESIAPTINELFAMWAESDEKAYQLVSADPEEHAMAKERFKQYTLTMLQSEFYKNYFVFLPLEVVASWLINDTHYI